MLDLAFGLTETSRLGCQIVMTEALDGLVVKLPAGTRNMLERPERRCAIAASRCRAASTAASSPALLHEAGHEVIGVTLQLYDHGAATGRKGACCAGQDIHDARRVADRLGIPHYVIDAEAAVRATR